MKLLVTGGLGFIGSNFILKLLTESNDYEIVNIDAELFGADHKNLSEIKNSKKYHFEKGNITNINDANPFLVSNIRGAYTILDIITEQKKRMIQISTDEVFGSLENGTADEQSKLNPSSPYAATKAAAELLANSYSATYGSDVIITRCTNNYGPHQFAEKLIPKTIGLCKQDRKIPIYGTGKSIRDWIHVQDHCEAIMLVLEKGKSGESYNISASNEIDNVTIVKSILTLLEKPENRLQFGEKRPGEDLRYSLNSSKIRKELDWKPKINFDEGLEKTIEWYISNDDWWKNISQETFSSTPWKSNN